MNSYFYPTESGWFDVLLGEWMNSGKRTLAFPFLNTFPHTLAKSAPRHFWMYLYFTGEKTSIQELRRTVPYRVRVVRWSRSAISGEHVHTHDVYEEQATIWFECDLAQELRTPAGVFLTDQDFKHVQDRELLSSIRNSIAPVKRVAPLVVVQATGWWLQD